MRVMLLGRPIIQREVVALLRTRKAFWLLFVTVALSILFSLIAWPSAANRSIAAAMSMRALLTFLWLELFLALITIPAFTAGAIAGERERETYDLLHSTLLPPHSIVLAKLLASVGYVLILLCASAPAVCLLYLLGGVEFSVILKCYGVIFAAVIASALVCLAHSMRSARTSQAAVQGIAALFIWNGGLLFILGFIYAGLNSMTNGGFDSFLRGAIDPERFLALCPFPVILGEMEAAGSAASGPWTDLWLFSLLWSSIFGLGHYFYLLARVRRPGWAPPATPRGFFLRRRSGGGSSPIRRTRFTSFLIRHGENGAPLLSNPIFLKEIRSESFGRLRHRRALFWSTLIILAVVGAANARAVTYIDTWLIAITFLPILFILFLTPATGGSALPKEIEQGNLDFLRGTLISMRQVVVGKFLATIYSVVGAPAAGGLMLLVALALYSPWAGLHLRLLQEGGKEHFFLWSFWTIFVWAMVTGMTLLFTAAIASLASALSRRSMGGILLAYLGTAGVYLFLPILLEAASPGSHPLLAMTHPFVTFKSAIRSGSWWDTDFGPSIIVPFTMIYAIGSAILLAIAKTIAEERRSRDP